MSLSQVSTAAHVEAEVNYHLDEGQRPVNYAYPPPAGVPQSSAKPLPTRVRITDARQLAERPTLDRNGFQLLAHRSALADFRDETQIRSIYYPESEALLERATGAAKVVIFDHTLRLDVSGHGQQGIREPVRRVHNDQTFVSGPRRVRDHLPAEEAEQRLKKRFAIVNLWRPIGSRVETAPLAMCDGRSIAVEDLVASDLVYPDKVGETYALLPNARHRWYYFSRVRADEVILLKIYDSLDAGNARLSAHTAFDDPTTPPGAAPRQSIELRSLLFWED